MSNGVMWGSVLLLEGLGVPGENHKYLANVHLRGRNHLTVFMARKTFLFTRNINQIIILRHGKPGNCLHVLWKLQGQFILFLFCSRWFVVYFFIWIHTLKTHTPDPWSCPILELFSTIRQWQKSNGWSIIVDNQWFYRHM